MIAFGGLNWALDGAAAPVAAVARLQGRDGPGRARSRRATAGRRACQPARSAFRDVTFAYPAAPDRPVLRRLSLEIPAGSSLAIVGQNGAGKTTLAKLLCRLYDPQSGAIEVDGIDLRDLDLEAWRRQVTAVFQDFVRFELTLRENVVPRETAGGSRTTQAWTTPSTPRSPRPGRRGWPSLDTVLAKGYTGGTDLSGGQWQRVALARALAAVRLGAGLVLLDEPTAQLDVRGRDGDLRAHPRGHPVVHDDPHLAPVHHRQARRPDRGRGPRRRRRTGQPRRADGAARPLLADVLAAGGAVRRRDARGRRGRGDLRCPLLTPRARDPQR